MTNSMKSISPYLVFCVVLAIAIPCFAMPYAVTLFLAKYMHFNANDLSDVEDGNVVAKPIDTDVKRELAFIGATHVDASPSTLIAQFRDIENFKKADEVLKVKKMSTPPVRKDFSELTLEPNDIKDLKKCKPGKCDLKLSAAMITNLQKALKRGKAIDSVYRDLLFEYVQNYLATGNAALCEYNDEKKIVNLKDEFEGILSNSVYLKEYYPALYEHLEKQKPLPGAEKFIYWSKETLGFRPVITITEVTIYQTPKDSVIISKQIYANHYMDGSMAITLIMPDQKTDPGQPGFYMMYINRSRTDMLGGLLAGLKRSIAKSRSTSALKENLALIKKRLKENTD
jgi:hypothetical protein